MSDVYEAILEYLAAGEAAKSTEERRPMSAELIALLEMIDLRMVDVSVVPEGARKELADRLLTNDEVTDAERVFLASVLLVPEKWPKRDSERAERRAEIAIWSLVADRFRYGNVKSAVVSAAKRFNVSRRQVWAARAELKADARKSLFIDRLLDAMPTKPAPRKR